MPVLSLTPVIAPVIALVLLGYGLGRLNQIDLKSVAALAIYVFTPIVGFGAAAQLDLTPSLLLLPLISFSIAALVGLGCLFLASKLICPNLADRYLLPIAAGSGNTGYFGLPLAAAVMGEQYLGVYLLGMLGVTIYESTLGYYFISRGTMSAREAVRRALKLPLLYALIAGLLVASLDLTLPAPFLQLWGMSRGAYVCIGMMIVGLALAQSKTAMPDAAGLKLISLAMIGKFVLWPLAALSFIWLDMAGLQILTPVMQQSLVLLSVVPMAANLCAYAAQNAFATDRAASLVLLSTVFGLVLLPFILPHLLALLA